MESTRLWPGHDTWFPYKFSLLLIPYSFHIINHVPQNEQKIEISFTKCALRFFGLIVDGAYFIRFTELSHKYVFEPK